MKILSCVVLTFCSFVTLAAQERVMDKAEFETMVTGGYAHSSKWKGEKYRRTVTTSTKAVGQLQTDFSTKTIIEYGSGTDSRSTSNSVFGDKPNHVEVTMRVGNWVYRRSGDKPWTRKEYAVSTASPERPESPVELIEANAQYKYLGSGSLKDQPVHIYVKTERRTTVSKSSGDASETDSKTTYWIGADGMILKNEYTAESRGPKFTSQTVVVMQYELDPSISFVAPEIVP